MTADSTPGYDLLYDIIRRRASVRKLKPDPIPEFAQIAGELFEFKRTEQNLGRRVRLTTHTK